MNPERTSFLVFLQSRFAVDHWTEVLYSYLRCHFGVIAHFNSGGFFRAWFQKSPVCDGCGQVIPATDLRWAERIRDFPSWARPMTGEEKWIRRQVLLHLLWDDPFADDPVLQDKGD